MGFLDVLSRIGSDPSAERGYKQLLDAAYDDLENMGRYVSDDRAKLRTSLNRVQLAFKHVHRSEPEKCFTIGDSFADGTIVAVEDTVIGSFYRLEIDATLARDVFGGLKKKH